MRRFRRGRISRRRLRSSYRGRRRGRISRRRSGGRRTGRLRIGYRF